MRTLSSLVERQSEHQSLVILCSNSLEVCLRGNPLSSGCVEIFVRQSTFFFSIVSHSSSTIANSLEIALSMLRLPPRHTERDVALPSPHV